MNLRTHCSLILISIACVLLGLAGAQSANAQFPANNVTLNSWIDLSTFGSNSGNDCWGYVSPSGREYALMGLSNKVAFVEITDPNNPDWFASIGHSSSVWCDVKVYQDHAYIVTEGGSGLQVVDMSNIDNHVVTLVRTIFPPSSSHNVAIDTTSGYLYTSGRYMFDLADPGNPVYLGRWNGDFQHDLQVVTYTSGPYAGRQILFGSSEGSGLDIIDVTDKANTFLVSNTPYPNVAYCHQAWTEDLQYIYIDDEADAINRTTVMDITSLENPVYLGDFSSGLSATDHNLYVHDGIIYEADYHSGLRIFDASSDPLNPEQIGWFDTYPSDDGPGYDGAWSCYPFFPSGTVIVSDIDRGLFILDVSEALSGLVFNYPAGRPAQIDPDGGTTMRVEVSGRGSAIPQPGTGMFYYDIGGGFVATAMNVVAPNVYDAVFPAASCGQSVLYYVSAETTAGTVYTNPGGAPQTAYSVQAAYGRVTVLEDSFDADPGWTTQGQWAFGQPTGQGGNQYGNPDPVSGATGAYVYGVNLSGDYSTTPSGPYYLTVGPLDLSGYQGVSLSFQRWLNTDYQPYVSATLEASNNGSNWVLIWENGSSGEITDNSWSEFTYNISPIADGQATVYIRWGYGIGSGAYAYSGWNIDDVKLTALQCQAPCPGGADGDMNEDLSTNGDDIQLFVDALLGTPGPSDVCHGDFSDDSLLDTSDIPGMVAALLAP